MILLLPTITYVYVAVTLPLTLLTISTYRDPKLALHRDTRYLNTRSHVSYVQCTARLSPLIKRENSYYFMQVVFSIG